MKLEYVLTACDLNPLYCDFIPPFIQAWNKLHPGVKVVIVLISDELPEQLKTYASNIVLFPPIEGLHTAFQAQAIRLLYPALLDTCEGVLITDMDMIPMNHSYYTKNIDVVTNDKFICFRDVLQQYREIAMCYNLATPQVWGRLFDIASEVNIIDTLKLWYQGTNYLGIPGKSGWTTDQTTLYKVLNRPDVKPQVVYLNDTQQGYNRLNRSIAVSGKLTREEFEMIKAGRYSDYHMHRPYGDHKQHIDLILSLLSPHTHV